MRRVGYRRKFGGKIFTLGGFRKRKSDAKKTSSSIRKMRKRKVRIVKAKGGWAIYERG
jgi:hypothetical protein